MDILKSIEEQIQEIQKMNPNISLEAVKTHIQRAEILYELGKNNGDQQYFTDVIYRTNQAFEGSLKQAYMILTGQPEAKVSKKRTVDVEDYFASNSIFHQRVLHHFKNYRQEWRNKSTHDFKLFFSESEAFLAIVNVSAYSFLLFNQIIERIAYNIDKDRLEKANTQKEIINQIVNQKDFGLQRKLIELIKEFSKNELLLNTKFKEVEIIGAFAAFLDIASENFEVESEVFVSIDNQKMNIDLLINSDDEESIIEIRKSATMINDSFQHQILKFMEAGNIKNTIIWFPRYVSADEDLEIINQYFQSKNDEYNITIIK